MCVKKIKERITSSSIKFIKGIKLGNKAGKSVDPSGEEGANPMDNSVAPLNQEAPLAMMEIEKTPSSTPMHDVPPPPDK